MRQKRRIVMAVIFCAGWLVMAVSARAADAPKLPQITDAQRAKFWRAAKEIAEWQARLMQAQQMVAQWRQEVEQQRAALAATCGDQQVLAETDDREPTCQTKPAAPAK